MKKEYIERNALIAEYDRVHQGNPGGARKLMVDAPAVDVVEVDAISQRIIRKNAEVSEYWQNDVKRYRATKGYSDIEHDVDNFLRGYNEAVEDMLAILEYDEIPAPTLFEHKGYELQQSSYNNHYMIFKDGKPVMHCQCTEKLDQKAAEEAIEFYIKMSKDKSC